MNEEILKGFAQLAGLSEEDAQAWAPVCDAAAAELRSQLKPGTLTAEQESLFCSACSALAFYRYTLAVSAAGEESFSAGDVQISRGTSGSGQAKLLWQEMQGAIAPLLEDPEFLFRRMGG